jgi:hypothetical protein
VSERTREQVASKFDDLDAERYVQQIVADLRNNNPELLDMAEKCARDVGDPERILAGYCMFYRLLTAQADADRGVSGTALSALPWVTVDTRAALVREIDEVGSQAFTVETLDHLEWHNPELLQMAHHFASGQTEYLGVMQGFALLWASLAKQHRMDRIHLH